MPAHAHTKKTAGKNTAKPARRASAPSGWWVRVVELLDPDLPRRSARKPVVMVSITTADPATWDDWATRRSASSSPPDRAQCGVVVRRDLSSRRRLTSRADAQAAALNMRTRLSRQGYTVNGDLTVHSLYVIELDASAVPTRRRPAGFRGYVYVGTTGKDPAARVEQHRLATRSHGNNRGYSTKVHSHFVRRRPDLEPTRVWFDTESALLAESRLRVRLENRGFVVLGGQERLHIVRRAAVSRDFANSVDFAPRT